MQIFFRLDLSQVYLWALIRITFNTWASILITSRLRDVFFILHCACTYHCRYLFCIHTSSNGCKSFLNEGSCCLFGTKTVLVLFTDLENVCMWVVSAFKSLLMTNMSYLQTRIWKVKPKRTDLNKKKELKLRYSIWLAV